MYVSIEIYEYIHTHTHTHTLICIQEIGAAPVLQNEPCNAGQL